MYKVIKAFTDLQDNEYVYREGDTFPREGVLIKEDRYAELASKDNKRGEALIEKAEEDAAETAEIPAKQAETKEVEAKSKPKTKTSKKEK